MGERRTNAEGDRGEAYTMRSHNIKKASHIFMDNGKPTNDFA